MTNSLDATSEPSDPSNPSDPSDPSDPSEPPEHARFAEYVRALDAAPAAEAAPLIRRILTEDPDRQMARAAVVRHLDARAAERAGTDDATWRTWTAPLTEAIGDDPFLTLRLQEWTLVHQAISAHSWSASTLSAASDWLQRRLTETPGVPAPVLAFLAEHGRTKRVRAAARRPRRPRTEPDGP
ncbi:hypothetical protein ABZ725_27285 [Streptomyces sp. NPDC006872]|uniref:hypothetical protein n=1 Tax=Streptomyces sp. NPDC006872 TaxID=3155720 RepID=UPI0033E58272